MSDYYTEDSNGFDAHIYIVNDVVEEMYEEHNITVDEGAAIIAQVVEELTGQEYE